MMSEKIEINTLITKHENKYKNCRFDMIDVEDPLWEYGYPLKRVLIDNQTGETYDEVGKLVGLLNELETKCHKLEKENEELKQKIDFYKYFQKDARELEKENEQLQKDVENLQELVAELGATLLINGFEIEINDENLSELIDDE